MKDSKFDKPRVAKGASPLSEMGAKGIIAVYLTTNREYKRPEDIVDVLVNTFDIGLNNIIKQQIQDDEIFMIQPKLTAYNKADTSQTEKLIEEGYEATIKVLE